MLSQKFAKLAQNSDKYLCVANQEIESAIHHGYVCKDEFLVTNNMLNFKMFTNSIVQ